MVQQSEVERICGKVGFLRLNDEPTAPCLGPAQPQTVAPEAKREIISLKHNTCNGNTTN